MLAECAAAVLRANDRGTYTVPARGLYPHQWAWDSAFAAIGWACLDLDRAATELESLFDAQWADGRVPHITFRDLSVPYSPGPELWGHDASSTITQPPVWATAARRLLDRGADPGRLAALLEPTARSHRFFAEQRDPLGCGAIAVVHPWESGRDNCPAWDDAMGRVDGAGAPTYARTDLGHVRDPGQRPTKRDYDRYLALVSAIREDGFGPGRFAVYDPMMTAILLRAEDDLADLAGRLDVPDVAADASDRAATLRKGLDTLWNDQLGRFVFLDAHAGAATAPDVLAAAMPLMVLGDDPRATRLRHALAARFDTAWPLPTTAPSDPRFEGRRYWRGPTWINMNWLLVDALGPSLAERTLALIAQAGFREYCDPRTGEGLGADDFTWTAALALDLLRRTSA